MKTKNIELNLKLEDGSAITYNLKYCPNSITTYQSLAPISDGLKCILDQSIKIAESPLEEGETKISKMAESLFYAICEQSIALFNFFKTILEPKEWENFEKYIYFIPFKKMVEIASAIYEDVLETLSQDLIEELNDGEELDHSNTSNATDC